MYKQKITREEYVNMLIAKQRGDKPKPRWPKFIDFRYAILEASPNLVSFAVHASRYNGVQA